MTIYQRPGLCLKIWPLQPELRQADSWHLVTWGHVPIGEASCIQNIYAAHGLAPRVYDLVVLNGAWLAQVTDYVAPAAPQLRLSEALTVLHHYGINVLKAEREPGKQLAEEHRWIGGQIVDFGRFYFPETKTIEDQLKHHIYRYHKKPHAEQIGYQPCPDLGIGGRRQIGERLEQMGLSSIDFAGKTVLDIGCNHGEMTRQISRRGTARAVGLDHKYIRGNRILSAYLGDWTVEFHEVTLPGNWGKIRELAGIEAYDYVLCLSVIGHAGGYAKGRKALRRLVGGSLFFSGQGNEERAKYEDLLREDYAQVRWLGYVTDNGRHPLWRCDT